MQSLSKRLADLLLEGYKFSSTQINLPPEYCNFLLDWGRSNIPDSVLNVDEGGREEDGHITVLFGLLESEPSDALREVIESMSIFKASFGPVSLFRNNGYDVAKVNIISPGLRQLNLKLRARCANEQTHSSYCPHATLAYVAAGSCDKLVGDELFSAEGAPKNSFWVKEVLFSGKTGHKETISLKRVKELEEALPDVDPFAGVPFADTERLLRLKASRKRAEQRPVL